MMNRFLILYLILTFYHAGLTQPFTKGLILPDMGANGSYSYCCIFVPPSGLNLYHQPKGRIIGQIIQDPNPPNTREFYRIFIQQENTQKELKPGDISTYMVGYEVLALAYIDKTDRFVKLSTGHWLAIEELTAKKLNLLTYMDYIQSKPKVLGYYANPPGLNLRKGPSTDFEKIITMKGDLFEIKPLGEIKGMWGKVEVSQYDKHPCFGGKVIRTYTGWTKLISDDHTLNVWAYGKGC